MPAGTNPCMLSPAMTAPTRISSLAELSAPEGEAPEGTGRLARMSEHDDATLVAKLYDAHHDAARSFARRLLGDAAAAEDLVQEVFLRVPAACRRHRGE